MLRRCLAAIALVALTAACGTTPREATLYPAPNAPVLPTTTTVDAHAKIYDPNRDANADIASALAQAATDHKYVLVDFGANWCPPCHTLDRVFHSKPVSETLKRDFLVVPVDIGETKEQIGVLNVEVMHRYGLTHSSIPVLAILSPPDGKLVATSHNGSFDNGGEAELVNSFLITYGPRAGK